MLPAAAVHDTVYGLECQNEAKHKAAIHKVLAILSSNCSCDIYAPKTKAAVNFLSPAASFHQTAMLKFFKRDPVYWTPGLKVCEVKHNFKDCIVGRPSYRA